AIEEARPLREHERAVPLRGELLELVDEALGLRRSLGVLPGEEPTMTGRLAEAEERLERREDAAAFGELLDDLLARRRAHRVVRSALGVVELAVRGHVGARWQLGEHLGLL